MVDLYSILAGEGQTDNEYRAEDPFFQSGVNVFRQGLPAPTSNAEAIFGPLAQGLIGGALMGYGRDRANQAAYSDYRSSPLLAALRPEASMIGPVADGELYADALSIPYLSEKAPEGWTAKQGRQDLILQALQGSMQQEENLENIKSRNELTKLLLGKDATLNDKGQIVSLKPLIDIEAERTAATEAAKVRGQNAGWGGDAGENPDSPQAKKLQKVKDEEDARRKEIGALLPAQKITATLTALPALEVLAKDNTKTSDIPFVYQFIQSQDGGVVKEGETARVEGAAPVLGQFKAQLEGALNGTSTLTPAIKQQMVTEMKRIALAQYKNFSTMAEPYFMTGETRGAARDRMNPFPANIEQLLAVRAGASGSWGSAGTVTAPDGRKIRIID